MKRINIIVQQQKVKIKKLKFFLKTIFCSSDLNKLGLLFQTDKIGSHSYTQHYNLHFRKYRFQKINLLEIGVGGYKDPNCGGNSLRMWKRYFHFGKIFSVDIHDKSAIEEKRIKIFQGSQVDEKFLNVICERIGDIDIIIDDGSHLNSHVIETFKILFPKLKNDGIYVVEDTQTSYWPNYEGDSMNLNNPSTMMNFFKSLTDCLNNKEFIRPGYVQTYFDKNIVSIHFYHNLIFIYKGNNDENSNMVKNNVLKF